MIFGWGRLAQLVEHLVYTEGVKGSSPLLPTIKKLIIFLKEHLSYNQLCKKKLLIQSYLYHVTL